MTVFTFKNRTAPRLRLYDICGVEQCQRIYRPTAVPSYNLFSSFALCLSCMPV